MTGWIYTNMRHSNSHRPYDFFYRKTNCVPKFTTFPATCLLLKDIASCFARRFGLVCCVSLVVDASSLKWSKNVCSTLEAPSLATACGYSSDPLYMTAVERQLQQQPDLVDPLSCPRANKALIHKVRKLSLSQKAYPSSVAYLGIFLGGGGSTNSVEDRGQRTERTGIWGLRFNKFSWGQRTERTGIWGRRPLVRSSGGSCNLVQEISFHIVKFS